MGKFASDRPAPFRRSHHTAGGFTLVELLVVIGIIAILVALLLPALARARWEARMVNCMSNQRSIIVTMTSYASVNDGNFPRYDEYLAAGDAPSLGSNGYFKLMIDQYNTPLKIMFCPFEPEDYVDLYRQFGFPVTGYGVWSPRLDKYYPLLFPPSPAGPTGNCVIKDPSGSAAGPANLRDKVLTKVPLITDIATTSAYVPPSGYFDDPAFPVVHYNDALPGGYYHFLPSSRPGPINEGYGDGHVERVNAHNLTIRYTQGPFVNWR